MQLLLLKIPSPFHYYWILLFENEKGANAMMNVKGLPVIHSNSIKYSCKWDDEIRFYFEHLIRIICLLNHLVGILNELTWTAVIVWWLVTNLRIKNRLMFIMPTTNSRICKKLWCAEHSNFTASDHLGIGKIELKKYIFKIVLWSLFLASRSVPF